VELSAAIIGSRFSALNSARIVSPSALYLMLWAQMW